MDIQLKLRVSEKMSKRSGEEEFLIRIPKRARETHKFKKSRLNVKLSSGGDISLKIREVYKDDLRSTDIDDRSVIGFVTKKVFFKITNKVHTETAPPSDYNEYFWITDEDEPLMMGCDPEFLLLDKDDRVVGASSILDHISQLGSDGTLAELRPEPSENVKVLVGNLKNLLKNSPNVPKILHLNWKGGACIQDHELGGHVHIGTPSNIHDSFKYLNLLTAVLDDYLTAPFTTVDAPDAIKRRQGHYGWYLGYRTDHGRLEWRTPSGFWLVHPTISRAFLGTTKAVAETFWGRAGESKLSGMDDRTIKERGEENTLIKTFDPFPCSETQRDIFQNKISKDKLKKSVERFKSLEYYSKYKHEITSFVDIVTMKKDVEKLGIDIKQNWRIS